LKTLKLIAASALLIPTLASAITTITVHKNNQTQSTCSRLCPTLEGCIGKAMEFDRKGGHNGRYKSIVVKSNGKTMFMKNYRVNKDFNNLEGFYQK